MNEKQKLFRAVYSALIAPEYQSLMEDEVVRVAMGAIVRFCDTYGVKIDFNIKSR